MFKFVFDLIGFVGLHLFPFGTLNAGTATTDAPTAWAIKLAYFNTWTFTFSHLDQAKSNRSDVN